MARTGRPRKSGDLREVTVSCRVTEAEWQYLDGLKLNEGFESMGDLVRSLLLAGMPRETPAETDPPAGDRLDQFLKRHPWGH